MTFLLVFVALFVGHHAGDHLFQTDWQANHKAGKGVTGALALAGHVGEYLICQAVGLAAVAAAVHPLPAAGCAAALALSGVTHAFIDRRWPVHWFLTHTRSREHAARIDGTWPTGLYHADQALHFVVLFGAALLAGAL